MYDLSQEMVGTAAVFLIAGAVKGVIGMGLPTVSLGLLTVYLGLDTAITLMVIPSLVTNLWQAFKGGQLRQVVRRTWPFLTLATGTIWFGVWGSSQWNPSALKAILSLVLILYGLLGLIGPAMVLPVHWRTTLGVVAGSLNGLLTGMTGSFIVPGVLYLQSIQLARDQLIQAMGLLFTLSTAMLAVALFVEGRFAPGISVASALCVLPALLGLAFGGHLRRRINEHAFRKVFYGSCILLGAAIMAIDAL